MIKKVWNVIVSGIKSIFCRDTISKVWKILFGSGKSAIGSLLSDTALMDSAFKFSYALATGSDTVDRRATFDAKLKEWAKSNGYEIGTSALNAIREVAYAAVKAQAEQNS